MLFFALFLIDGEISKRKKVVKKLSKKNSFEDNQKSNVIESKRLVATRNSHIDKQFNKITISMKNSPVKEIAQEKNPTFYSGISSLNPFDVSDENYWKWNRSSQSEMVLVSIECPFADRIVKGDLWKKGHIKKILQCLEDYIDFIGCVEDDSYSLSFSPVRISVIDAILNSNRSLKDKWCGIISASLNFTSEDYVSQHHSSPFNLNDKDELILKHFNNRESLDNLAKNEGFKEILSFESCASYLMPIFPFYSYGRRGGRKGCKKIIGTIGDSNGYYKKIDISERTLSYFEKSSIIVNLMNGDVKIGDIDFSKPKSKNDLCIIGTHEKYNVIESFLEIYPFFANDEFMSEIEKDLTPKQLVDLVNSVKVLMKIIINKQYDYVLRKNFHWADNIDNYKKFIVLQKERILQGFEKNENSDAINMFNEFFLSEIFKDMMTENEVQELRTLKYNHTSKHIVNVINESFDFMIMEAFLRKDEWFDCFVDDYETIEQNLRELTGTTINTDSLYFREYLLFNKTLEENERFRQAFKTYTETMSLLDFIVEMGDVFPELEKVQKGEQKIQNRKLL